MRHQTQPAGIPRPGSNPGDAKPDDALDVRSANHDIIAFAEQIVTILDEDEPAVVDVSQHQDHGNRILLQTYRRTHKAVP